MIGKQALPGSLSGSTAPGTWSPIKTPPTMLAFSCGQHHSPSLYHNLPETNISAKNLQNTDSRLQAKHIIPAKASLFSTKGEEKWLNSRTT